MSDYQNAIREHLDRIKAAAALECAEYKEAGGALKKLCDDVSMLMREAERFAKSNERNDELVLSLVKIVAVKYYLDARSHEEGKYGFNDSLKLYYEKNEEEIDKEHLAVAILRELDGEGNEEYLAGFYESPDSFPAFSSWVSTYASIKGVKGSFPLDEYDEDDSPKGLDLFLDIAAALPDYDTIIREITDAIYHNRNIGDEK
jgi:hypothetical protein